MARRDSDKRVSGGACLVAGFVAMWICYAITRSVAVSWAAFFIVGALVYYG